MNGPHASADPTLSPLPGLLPELQALYTDVQAHPELSMQEDRISTLAADKGSRPAKRNSDEPQSPFASVIHPTLQTGAEAMVVAARAWLAP
jgi:hypothetical protein